jgi:hypothetical protein
MTGAARDWAREFNPRIAGTMIASHETRFVEACTALAAAHAMGGAGEGRLIAKVTTTHVVPGS